VLSWRIGVDAEGQVLERAEQGVVDEVQQFVARDALGVGGPVAPAELGRDGGLVAALHQFVFLLPVVEDLEEKHPAELGDPLRVAVHAGVLAHDVLDGLDGGGNRHGATGVFMVLR